MQRNVYCKFLLGQEVLAFVGKYVYVSLCELLILKKINNANVSQELTKVIIYRHGGKARGREL